jgi:catechol 2,3-dioxygenase-like lactoylglutathione lyase family enzyme
MATLQVRYIVNDVNAAIAFYCEHLGFKQVMHPSPVFAMLTRGDLRLVLSAPNPSIGRRRSTDARWHATTTRRLEQIRR